jgi:TRAP-type C4-dicarboxylate transport system permease small subunit
MNILEKMSLFIDKIVRLFIGCVLFVMLFLVVTQVLLRYIFHMPLAWTDEVSRYLMTWLVFIGSCVASRECSHLGVTIIFDKMNSRVKAYLTLLINVLVCGFLGLVVYQSYFLLEAIRIVKSPVLQISMSIPYASVFIGCILIFFQTMVATLKSFNHCSSK